MLPTLVSRFLALFLLATFPYALDGGFRDQLGRGREEASKRLRGEPRYPAEGQQLIAAPQPAFVNKLFELIERERSQATSVGDAKPFGLHGGSSDGWL